MSEEQAFQQLATQAIPLDQAVRKVAMNSMQTCNSVTFYFKKNSFSDVSRKWILPNMTRAGTALIIFGKIHILLISENKFFMKYNVTEGQVFMEFMTRVKQVRTSQVLAFVALAYTGALQQRGPSLKSPQRSFIQQHGQVHSYLI